MKLRYSAAVSDLLFKCKQVKAADSDHIAWHLGLQEGQIEADAANSYKVTCGVK